MNISEEFLSSKSQEIEIAKKAVKNNYNLFFHTILKDSIESVEGEFLDSSHFTNWNTRLQMRNKTVTLSARKHAKSTTLYGFILWNFFTSNLPYLEILYLSYKLDLAQYHLRKVRSYIQNNPYFGNLQPISVAESILRYKDGKKVLICEPEGVLSFKRGRHPHIVICDDILMDPTVKLDMTQIEKITKIYMEQIESLPREGGQLHLMGTAQDRNDLFFQLRTNSSYDWKQYPAVMDRDKQQVLWKEMFPFSRLEEIRMSLGERAFLKEYQCSPVYTEDAFFKDEDFTDIINLKLKNLTPDRDWGITNNAYGGLDIGKKNSPSHLVVYKEEGDVYVQLLSKWMDRWDYTNQIELCKKAVNAFNIRELDYDNTRGEFEGFAERHELPRQMVPVTLNFQNKTKMAADFDQIVRNGQMEMVNDKRQLRQIVVVDNSLRAPETVDGHGDAFWSNALMLNAALKFKKRSKLSLDKIYLGKDRITSLKQEF